MAEPRSLIEGKYEILDTIQEGEASAIYKVRHLHLDEIRVIKVMHPQRGASDEQARRFLQEAKTLTRLKHPNICTILDLFQDAAGTTYIVLEFIDGVNMSELLKASGLPSLPMALEIAHQTLLALGCLHRRNIIHRDIAPDNIMLTMDEDHEPHVKLIGLGVAKMLGGTVELTSSGEFVGKMKYSSPEQLGALDEGEKLDSRSDLYSLGVVLYQILTGAMPIRGEQPREILVGHLFLPPIPFFKSDPEGKVPQEVTEIVLKALEKRREKRFNSAEEFDEQVVSMKNRFATLEQSEITRPLTIGEAWRTPFKFSPSVSAARERSKPEAGPPTTPAVVAQPPVAAPTPPVPDEPTLVVKRTGPVPIPIVESPARAPTIPPPPPIGSRRRLPAVAGGVVAAGIVVAVVLLFLNRRSKPELQPQVAVAATPLVVTAASKPPALTAASSPRSPESPTPSEASRSMAQNPAPVPEPSMPAAEEARARASAARSAAEKEDARARAPNSYGRGRQKETEAQALFARQEYSFAETAFAAAEQLFRKAQESSAQSKREAARRQLSAPKLTPTASALATGPAQSEPVAAPTAPPTALQPPAVLREVGPNYPVLDTLPPGPDEIVIVVQAVVTERGDVRDVQVPNVQHLVLDRAAIYAVQNWRFRPATVNGRPVEVRIKVTSVVRRQRGFQGNRLKEVSRKTETIGLATPAP